MSNQSKTFCILPFIHLEARADSLVAPCCINQKRYSKPDGTAFSLLTDTLSDVWNSESIAEFRSSLLNGEKPECCSVCWKEEEYGKKSKRIRENDRFGTSFDGNIKFLDLKLGTTCNLKCRVCSPGSSSSWAKEAKEVDNLDIVARVSKKTNLTVSPRMVMVWPEYNKLFWDDLYSLLPTVELFEIYGGEPFMSKEHFDFLKRSVELGYSKNQTIHYNSNGTIYPTDAVTNIWPHFKSVDIMLSIDGINEQFEYQRYPAKWESVEKNIKLFNSTMPGKIMICLTVSAFNVFYLPEYLRYFESIGILVWLNMLYSPTVFCIGNLPDNAKSAVIQKLKEVESSVLVEPITHVTDFISYSTSVESDLINNILRHDAYRNEHYDDVFPEFARLINYDSRTIK